MCGSDGEQQQAHFYSRELITVNVNLCGMEEKCVFFNKSQCVLKNDSKNVKRSSFTHLFSIQFKFYSSIIVNPWQVIITPRCSASTIQVSNKSSIVTTMILIYAKRKGTCANCKKTYGSEKGELLWTKDAQHKGKYLYN